MKKTATTMFSGDTPHTMERSEYILRMFAHLLHTNTINHSKGYVWSPIYVFLSCSEQLSVGCY